ncbi:MAG: tyrosine-type recombinase/integrase [Planctomycetaceae bacterium]|nr:tyrosine-type recombinase/integrase [Planctomycetaceae bacterium]
MARPRKPWFRKSNRCWYVEIEGRQVRLGRDKTEALRRYHELMARKLGEPAPGPDMTFVEMADRFLEWVKKNRSLETYLWYQDRIERFCRKYPTIVAADVRPYMVEEWVGEYEIAVTTRRNYLRSVKRCFSWAKKQGYIERNPIEDLEVPRAEERDVCISEEEFARMMTFVRLPELSDLIQVSWETGCRPQESLRVEARHVDVVNQRWVFHKSEAKMERIARVVYLTDTALDITRRLMLAHPTGPLFRNSNGVPWSTDAVNSQFDALRHRMGKAVMEREGIEIPTEAITALIPSLRPSKRVQGVETEKTDAELRSEAKRKLTFQEAKKLVPRYSLYALRHSWATNALKRGVDSMTVAILMGHEDPSMLARVYQHLSQDPQHLLNQARKAVG